MKGNFHVRFLEGKALYFIRWSADLLDSGDVGRYNSLQLNIAGNPVMSYHDQTNGDLKLAVCSETTCKTGHVNISTVDSNGDVGEYSSLQLNNMGNPVISYYDNFPNYNLKLAVCIDPYCTQANITVIDDTDQVGLWTSLQLNSAGNPVISYFDNTNLDLKLAICSTPTCSSKSILKLYTSNDAGRHSSLQLNRLDDPVISFWARTSGDLVIITCYDPACYGRSFKTLVSSGDVGEYSALQLNSLDNPVIAYRDSTNGNVGLVTCTDATCSSDSILTIVDANGIVGEYLALQLNSNNYPLISYYDASNSALKLAVCHNPTCSNHTLTTIDSFGDVGKYTALQLDIEGNPLISYYGNYNLKLATILVNSIQSLENTNGIAIIDSDGDVGRYNSLQLNIAGNPVMSYHDQTNGDLKLAVCSETTCKTGHVNISTVDSNGDVGEYSSLQLNNMGNPVISYYDNFPNYNLKLAVCIDPYCTQANITVIDDTDQVGLWTSLQLNSAGNPVISYFDDTNLDLKLAICSTPTCSSKILRSFFYTLPSAAYSEGRFTSVQINSAGNPVVSCYDDLNDDLKLVVCGNPACTSGNTITIVDSDGNVGLHTSLQLNIAGNPVISYYDDTNSDLKLAVCGNPTCTSGNTITTVDSDGNVGYYTSLQLNNAGNPVISYYDGLNRDLKLAVCGNPTCTSGNTITIVDFNGNLGTDSFLQLNSAGNPVISYHDGYPNYNLKLTVCGNPTCTSGNTITTVDSGSYLGSSSSLRLDSVGNPVISYYDDTNSDLKLAVCGNPTCTSGNTITTVDSDGNLGWYTSLQLNSAGNPVISYYDGSNGDLKLAVCGNPTCTSGNTITIVDSDGNVGLHTSLQLNIAGNPVISYYDDTNSDLKLAFCYNPTCSSVMSLAPYTRMNSDVGRHSSLQLNRLDDPVISFWDRTSRYLTVITCHDPTCASWESKPVVSSGEAEEYSSLQLNNIDHPVIAYHDGINGNIGLVICSDATCSANSYNLTIVDSAGLVGEYNALQLNSNNCPLISYYDANNSALKLAVCHNPTCSNHTLTTIDSFGDVGKYTALQLDIEGNPLISYYGNYNLKLATILVDPTNVPTSSPISSPTGAPSQAPTSLPTLFPTKAPSQSPTNTPTNSPSQSPISSPTYHPTTRPTFNPSEAPSSAPSVSPTKVPSLSPSLSPSLHPSSAPTYYPTTKPMSNPSEAPSSAPSVSTTLLNPYSEAPSSQISYYIIGGGCMLIICLLGIIAYKCRSKPSAEYINKVVTIEVQKYMSEKEENSIGYKPAPPSEVVIFSSLEQEDQSSNDDMYENNLNNHEQVTIGNNVFSAEGK